MEYGWTEEHVAFRQQVRDFLDEHATPALFEELREGERDGLAREAGEGEFGHSRGPELRAFRKAMNEAGYTNMGWPVEYGGQGKDALHAFILAEELWYLGIPQDHLSVGSVGRTIMRFGTEEQKRDWLPEIVAGDMTFALGYTEPNAGTDLASLQTRATRDGDEWVINGQKIYGGFGGATHGWLAARTDPDAPKHQGISVFIFPTNVPGITVRPMGTMGRIITSETFFDNVRLPADALFGELNRGWYYMTNALDLERVMIEPQSLYQRRVDALVEHIEEQRPELKDDPVVQIRLAEATVDSEVSRALAMTNAIMVQNGITPTMEGAMVKVWGSEARYRMDSLALDLLGPEGGLRRENEDAPAGGKLEENYRGSSVHRFAGGTNDVLRRIIATRGLGLPRG